MNLPPVFSRFKAIILSEIKHFDWTQRREKIKEFYFVTIKKISWKSPKVIGAISFSVILIGGFTNYLATTTSAAAVIINGKQIGLVRNVDNGKNLVEAILKEEGQPFGLIAKTHDQISYQGMRLSEAAYLKQAISEKDLENNLTYYLDGINLEVDGSVVAVLPSKSAVDKVLKDYQNYYVKPGPQNSVSSVDFAEKVSTEATEVRPDQMTQSDQALQMLIDGKSIAQAYTVKPNDSWWLIARKNNMLTDEVLAGNPGATKDSKLQPGQIIKLVNVTPYLTVVSQGTYTGTEIVPHDVVTKTDYSLRTGQTKVVQQGMDGSKEVRYSYMQKNGIDVKKDVLSEKVLQAPVNQVIARGPSSSPVTIAYNASRGSNDFSSIVSRALSLVGTPYVFGGTGRGGFDCSGFTKYVFAGFGISLPRTSYEQFASGTPVSSNDLNPGDLVFFSTYAKGASHVGIYIGGGRFVQASNPSSGVKVSSMGESFYSSRYLGARRYN